MLVGFVASEIRTFNFQVQFIIGFKSQSKEENISCNEVRKWNPIESFAQDQDCTEWFLILMHTFLVYYVLPVSLTH
jgi:hypothetical protein